MNDSTAAFVVVFAAVGLVVGWHACKAWTAHGDVGGTMKKISGLKRARSHNGSITILVVIITLIVFYGLVTNHR